MNLLFDLDGTLTDPMVGITRCIQYALLKLGREPPASHDLTRFIGPPLQGIFAELLSTDSQTLIREAIALFRERFESTGMFENEVYPDVFEGLASLVADGHRLWVATSKPRIFAQRIIDYFALNTYFDAVYGSELDGRNSAKTDLIRCLLESEGISPPHTWMLGDRAQDIRGGRDNGLCTIGVLWGYGSKEELEVAGADWLARSMDEIVEKMRLCYNVKSPMSGRSGSVPPCSKGG